ncbi:hypothetical protein Q5752_002262 [Cryptotrichosporon argae]
MPWLMKAEPDSRIVKGKDVKFSVDDFEALGTSPWDGVRNHEAKNIMKDKMKLGDQVLFYHSNCKVPGVYAIAEVAQEGYPDHTAWDPAHPYYDPKSTEASPTWYMVSVRFKRRLANPVTLAGIKALVSHPAPPAAVGYIGADGLGAIRRMALVNRGRLSVQPVEQDAFEAIVALGETGGLEEPAATGKKRKADDGVGQAEETVDTKAKRTAKGEAKTQANGRASNKGGDEAEKREAITKKARSEAPAAGTRRSARKR